VKDNAKNEEWLLQFEKPSESVLKEIRRLIESLPAGGAKLPKILRAHKKEVLAVSGTEDVIKLLEASLTQDFEETSVEATTAPWVFDYVVFLESESKSCLNVMTRLHHRTKPGNIFYGRTVYKQGSEEYLWLNFL
jgi:hypothetical protein